MTPPAASRVVSWGRTGGGREVECVTHENDHGMQLACIDYGATLTAINVPDQRGQMRNVVLSLPDLASHERTRRRFGAVMGRYAGRIGGARFVLDGREIKLASNADGVALHGEPDGFDRRVWRRRDFSDDRSMGSTFHLTSADGDQQFPGRLDVSVTYRLFRQHNTFRIEYGATCDAPTVVNLTNHAFFNLAGAGSRGLASHRFQIHADRHAVTDARRVPTGELADVTGTPLDFRHEADISTRLESGHTLLGIPPGFDHSLLFAGHTGGLKVVATIREQSSGRGMEICTTEPSVQFFSGNGFDGSEIGSEGVGYQRHDGFAFETQHLPDSPNHAHFPSTTLHPGDKFQSITAFRFFVEQTP